MSKPAKPAGLNFRLHLARSEDRLASHPDSGICPAICTALTSGIDADALRDLGRFRISVLCVFERLEHQLLATSAGEQWGAYVLPAPLRTGLEARRLAFERRGLGLSVGFWPFRGFGSRNGRGKPRLGRGYYALMIMLMLIMALSWDYALFMLTRYKAEREAGATVEQATVQMVAKSGSIVVVSGRFAYLMAGC